MYFWLYGRVLWVWMEMKRMKNEEDIYETTLAIASFAACLVKINSQSFADKGSTKAAERK